MRRLRIDLFKAVTDVFKLDPFGTHGPIHWFNVYMNTKRIDPGRIHGHEHLYYSFALIHDCCRENEEDDPAHAARAAEFVHSTVTSDMLQDLRYAVLYHSAPFAAPVSHFQKVCWDADRLDLIRVGIMPDVERMWTQEGKLIARLMQRKKEQDEQRINAKLVNPNRNTDDVPDSGNDGDGI